MHYRRVLRTGDAGPPGPMRVRGTCQAEGCEEEVDAKGLCHGHYQRLLRHGVVDESPLRKGRKMCKVEACDRRAESKGYCPAHYQRVLKHDNHKRTSRSGKPEMGTSITGTGMCP